MEGETLFFAERLDVRQVFLPPGCPLVLDSFNNANNSLKSWEISMVLSAEEFDRRQTLLDRPGEPVFQVGLDFGVL